MKGKEEADRSVGGGPKEPGATGEGRRGGSGPLPWEPAASPSPTLTKRDRKISIDTYTRVCMC